MLILGCDLDRISSTTGLTVPVKLSRKQRRDLSLFFLFALQIAQQRNLIKRKLVL